MQEISPSLTKSIGDELVSALASGGEAFESALGDVLSRLDKILKNVETDGPAHQQSERTQPDGRSKVELDVHKILQNVDTDGPADQPSESTQPEGSSKVEIHGREVQQDSSGDKSSVSSSTTLSHPAKRSALRIPSPSIFNAGHYARTQLLTETSIAESKIEQALKQTNLHHCIELLEQRIEEEGILRRKAEAEKEQAEQLILELHSRLLLERRTKNFLIDRLRPPASILQTRTHAEADSGPTDQRRKKSPSSRTESPVCFAAHRHLQPFRRRNNLGKRPALQQHPVILDCVRESAAAEQRHPQIRNGSRVRATSEREQYARAATSVQRSMTPPLRNGVQSYARRHGSTVMVYNSVPAASASTAASIHVHNHVGRIAPVMSQKVLAMSRSRSSSPLMAGIPLPLSPIRSPQMRDSAPPQKRDSASPFCSSRRF